MSSNTAASVVKLTRGVFTDEGIIQGKVYVVCDCRDDGDLESDRRDFTQQSHEVGIPGVRVYLEDGTSVVTDVEGKYTFFGISPRLHVVKVDEPTLPAGAALVRLDNRQGGNPATRFVDLKEGELFRAGRGVGEWEQPGGERLHVHTDVSDLVEESLQPRAHLADRDRKSTRLNSSHSQQSRMPSSA